MRSPRSLALALSLASVVAACDAGRSRADSGAPARAAREWLVDDFGDTVRLGGRPARIVSLNPATTEILFAIGAGPRLVGRTTWDSWPDSARLVADLGPGIRPNVEAILGARPDLVVLYASNDNRATAVRLRGLGVTTAAFRGDHIADLRRIALALGRLVGDTARAHATVDSVERTLARVREATRALPRRTVVVPLWDAPLLAAGGGSFMTELVEIAGGRNVFDSLATPSPAVSFEDVVRRDPELVLTTPVARDRYLADPRWRALRAVREGRVLAFDTNLVQRPAVRLGEAARSLARLIHPGSVR